MPYVDRLGKVTKKGGLNSSYTPSVTTLGLNILGISDLITLGLLFGAATPMVVDT